MTLVFCDWKTKFKVKDWESDLNFHSRLSFDILRLQPTTGILPVPDKGRHRQSYPAMIRKIMTVDENK
jgi:hypothetical protein